MNDYFDSYLRRLNKDGDNFQRRVITRREKQFDAFLKRSIYYSNEIKIGDRIIEGSIAPTKDSERTQLYTLLTYKDNDVELGSLIQDKNNIWLAIHKLLDCTTGYNSYSVLLLDEKLSVEVQGEKITFPARYVYSIAEIEDYFTAGIKNRVYREPEHNIQIICKNYDFLEKDLKFIIENDTYKIEGINKIALPGCAYITLGQCLADEQKDKGEDNSNSSFWG